MSKTPVIITGFMASGKTTVAQALALKLGCHNIDLDHFITDRTGRSPKEIIELDGESAFREVETNFLREALDSVSPGVIALGGGAWTLERNRDLIAERNGITVWLDAPFELCWQRIATAGGQRPLAPDREHAHNLYLERRSLYQLAALTVMVSDETDLDGIVATIARAIESK